MSDAAISRATPRLLDVEGEVVDDRRNRREVVCERYCYHHAVGREVIDDGLILEDADRDDSDGVSSAQLVAETQGKKDRWWKTVVLLRGWATPE